VSERSTLRLVVLAILVVSLLLTLVSRLFFLQVVSADVYAKKSTSNGHRDIVTPATRGLILDQAGRALVSNRTSLVVSVDRAVLMAQPDHGKAVVKRLAKALKVNATTLSYKLELCGKDAHAKAPICWNGSPYQPIPVAKDISQDLAVRIMEMRSEYPGVTANLEAVRVYPQPYAVNAAHLLGYLGPVSDKELALQSKAADTAPGATPDPSRLRRTDLVGRAGLEAEYDRILRGFPGIKTVTVDLRAAIIGVAAETAPQPGDYLVTNIDAHLQSVVELELQRAIDKARATKERHGTNNYKADSGAAVVMDVTNGHILAMASYPSYDPGVWVGGISSKEYAALTSVKANEPLISRATQGQFAPASTFKIVTASAALKDGYSPNASYNCPRDYTVGTQTFKNFESESFGRLSMAKGIAVSCDTMWYEIAFRWWLQSGGLSPSAHPKDPVETMAKAFGIGRPTGIDLPSESSGRVGGREFKTALAAQLHDAWCKRAITGYPEVKDKVRAQLLTAIAKDNCATGSQFKAGDAVNMAIGQGNTLATPLQMAVAYAAVANGGTIWQPQVAKGIMTGTGKVVSMLKPKKVGTLPVSQADLAFLRKSFSEVTSQPFGTGYGPFLGFPLGKIPVGAKTGTGQAGLNKQSTSWFATFAPANAPKYVVVMMVSQGGTGSGTSAPSVRRIYEALFGIHGMTVDPATSVLVGGKPTSKMPKVGKDGIAVYPEEKAAGATPTTSTPPTPSPTSGLVALPLALGAGLRVASRRRRRAGWRPPALREWSP